MRHSTGVSDTSGANRTAARGERPASVRQIMRNGEAGVLRPSPCGLIRQTGSIGILDQFLEPACQQLHAIVGLNQAAEHLTCHNIGDTLKLGNQGNFIFREITIIKTIAHG